MANFILAFDPDGARRAAFQRSATERVAPFAGLRPGAAACGRLDLGWAAGPRAPVSVASPPDRLAVLWGEAIPGPGPGRLDAAALAAAWAPERGGIPSPWSGFYAGLLTDGLRHLRLGADLLGMFPVYYWHQGPVLLAGSSPELFRYHPLFRMRVSAEGLAGILLSCGLVGGQALLEGVRRLAAGHLLEFDPEHGPREVEQYRLPGPDPAFDLSISALQDELNAVLERTMSRCAPAGEPIAQLLSGGLDSRLLGGYLQRAGIRTLAITRGQHGDVEMRCARAVAQALGFEHRACPELTGDPVGTTRLDARWSHLANGTFSASDDAALGHVGPLPDRVLSGYAMDIAMHDLKMDRPAGDPWAVYFNRWVTGIQFGAWGFPEAVVTELLGDPAPVRRVLSSLAAEFRAAGPTPARALVAMSLRHGGRFRVGSIPWRLSFESWPALPALDREFLDTVAGMPMVAAGERFMEEALLCREFPALAALPLDRNSYDTTPLRPRLRYQLAQWLRARLGLVRGPGEPRRREQRYYFRVSAFDGPEWRAVRAAAEPLREKAAGILQPEALARHLQPPALPETAAAKLKGASGAKLLLTLLLWAAEHTPSPAPVGRPKPQVQFDDARTL